MVATIRSPASPDSVLTEDGYLGNTIPGSHAGPLGVHVSGVETAATRRRVLELTEGTDRPAMLSVSDAVSYPGATVGSEHRA